MILRNLGQPTIQVNRLQTQIPLSRRRFGHLLQVIDQQRQILNGFDAALPFLIRIRHDAVTHRLGTHTQYRQWRAQLMRGIGDPLPTSGFLCLQLRGHAIKMRRNIPHFITVAGVQTGIQTPCGHRTKTGLQFGNRSAKVQGQ